MRSRLFLSLAVLLAALTGVRSADRRLPVPGRDLAVNLPLAFEENRGQADDSVRFVARGPGYTVRLGDTDAVVRLSGGMDTIRMSLAGGARKPRVVPAGRARAVSHYLIGNDPAKWRTNVARYASVRYEQVYPGIDVVYYGNPRQLEYDFEVGPGADVARIAMDFAGARNLHVDRAGDLVLGASDPAIRLHKPIAYQDTEDGRRPVDARFEIDGDGHVRFALGDYDSARPLVIDPILGYSTYAGGGGADYAFGVAVDGLGNAYVTGATDSIDFPATAGAFDGTYGGTTGVPPRGDAFVMKLDPSGALVYATYVGGSDLDMGNAIAVDGGGNAYITGRTISTNFPTTPGALQTAWGNSPFSSNGDMFVTKLNASGSALVYSTFLGNASFTAGYGIAVDASGSAYVVGEAWFTFRTPNPLVQQPTSAFSDGFVAKLTPSGGGLLYATLLGGNDLDEVYGVAIDGSGNAFVMGRTSSPNFPVMSAAQPTYGGGQDTFVARLDAAGAKVYATFLGGNDFESAGGIAIDSGGNAYVTGSTQSANFPVTTGALRTTAPGLGDAFVTKLTASGAFAYSTYLGGAIGDSASAIAVTADGHAFVTGTTQSSNFPVVAAIQPAIGSVGTKDMFLTELNPAGSAALFSTYLGGTGLDEGNAIAIDASLNVYLAGRTQSTNFPTFSPFQASNNGGSSEIAIAKVRTVLPTMAIDKNALSFSAVTSGATTLSATGAQAVRLTQSGSGAVTWSAVPSVPWLAVAPASGSGSATLSISLAAGAVLPAPGTHAASVALTFNGAGSAPAGGIAVSLAVIANGTSAAPTGSFDTPIDGTAGVTGSIPVTGWAIDDVEVTRVRILRDPAGAEPAGLVYIGDAVLVDGARPDVAAQYPTAPRRTRAGWGYLMLTNFLPNLGNGTFRLYAVADDADGHSTTLGSKTITCTNSAAITPFGAIDTPLQGETVSGIVNDFGWVLSPGLRRADPTNGGVVQVLIDGVVVGAPSGWVSRPDLSALFPVAQFSGIGNALGVYTLDTTALTNGVHTIAWIVTDNQGGAAGVGSRYFTVSNGSSLTSTQLSAVSSQLSALSTEHRAPSTPHSAPSTEHEILMGRRGLDLDAPLHPYYPDRDGVITIQSEELDRIELHVGQRGQGVAGSTRVGGSFSPLPIGAHLDRATGIFTWHPGVGFLGAHDFVLGPHTVRIVLNPKGTNRVGPQVAIDLPAAGARDVSSRSFIVAGWAADLDATIDGGVDTVHVWAYPVSGRLWDSQPIFLGAAAFGGARPDVAAIHGERFGRSGYGIDVKGLAPGSYDIAVFAYSTVRGGFAPAKIVRVTVR